jgi:predicted nucleic acid-binding protein
MRKVIVNTTPIIALADVGQLELLRDLYGEITIPEAVLKWRMIQKIIT